MKEIDYKKEFSQIEEMKDKLKQVFDSHSTSDWGAKYRKVGIEAAKAYAQLLQAQIALKPENCR